MSTSCLRNNVGVPGVVTVETRGFNQDGVEVLYFRRKVLVPKTGTVDEQPGRPGSTRDSG